MSSLLSNVARRTFEGNSTLGCDAPPEGSRSPLAILCSRADCWDCRCPEKDDSPAALRPRSVPEPDPALCWLNAARLNRDSDPPSSTDVCRSDPPYTEPPSTDEPLIEGAEVLPLPTGLEEPPPPIPPTPAPTPAGAAGRTPPELLFLARSASRAAEAEVEEREVDEVSSVRFDAKLGPGEPEIAAAAEAAEAGDATPGPSGLQPPAGPTPPPEPSSPVRAFLCANGPVRWNMSQYLRSRGAWMRSVDWGQAS